MSDRRWNGRARGGRTRARGAREAVRGRRKGGGEGTRRGLPASLPQRRPGRALAERVRRGVRGQAVAGVRVVAAAAVLSPQPLLLVVVQQLLQRRHGQQQQHSSRALRSIFCAEFCSAAAT